MSILDTATETAVFFKKRRARKQIVTGIVFIGLGIFLAIMLKSFNLLMLSGLGVIAILSGWFNLNRLKQNYG